MFAVDYPEGGLWPEWVWQLIADIGVIAAVAAFIAALVYLWNHGPRLLIDHGPNWMTKLGLRWDDKREKAKDA